MCGQARVLAAALLLGGCMVGPNARNFGPGGVQVALRTTVRAPAPYSRVVGELLAAEACGLVVLSGGRAVRVRYGALIRASIPQSGYNPTSGELPNLEALAKLRMLSRYAQGIAPEILRRLLVSLKQDSLDVVPQ
jgi:hypothetical protein